MDKTEFIQLGEFEKAVQNSPDDILQQAQQEQAQEQSNATAQQADDDFLRDLGL